MLQNIITSFLAFVSTNIDDLFILMLFFGSGQYLNRDVFAGQYLGISLLVAISFIGSLVGLFIDARYIGLLGFFPIYLAIKQAVALFGDADEQSCELVVNEKRGVLAIAGVTIANGGDNIGVYVPLLATLSATGKVLLLVVFGVMVFVWCWLARRLAGHPSVARSLKRYGHFIMPAVLMLLGIYIIAESGAIALFEGT